MPLISAGGADQDAFKRHRICHLLLITAMLMGLLLLKGAGTEARAQEVSAGRSFALVASDWQHTFDQVERLARSQQLDEVQRRRLDALLAAAIEDARMFEADARREIEAQTKLLDALGPAPEEGQPAEARDVARERKDISDVVAVYRARLAQTELAVTRAAALQEQLATAVRQRFVERLLKPVPSPLAPGVLSEGVAAKADRIRQLSRIPADWWRARAEEQRQRLGWSLAMAALAAGGAAAVLRYVLLARASRRLAQAGIPPSAGQRLGAMAMRTVADGVVPVGVLGLPVLLLWVLTDLSPTGAAAGFVLVLLAAVAAMAVGAALARAALVPPEGENAALSPLTAASARNLTRCIGLLGSVLVVELALRQMEASLPPPVPAQQSTDAMIYCGLALLGLLLAARGSVWHILAVAGAQPAHEGTERWQERSAAAEPGADAGPAAPDCPDGVATPRRRDRPNLAKLLARGAAGVGALAVSATFAGYARFAVNLVDTLLWGATALALCLLARSIGRAAVGALLAHPRLQPERGVTVGAVRGILGTVRVLLDPALAALATWALAPLWGLAREDLARWGRGMMEGFTVGGVTISPVAVALAGVVFVVALAGARAGRRVLSERLLPRTRLDAGVQHSISVGASYIGVAAAILLAIAVLGVDLSNFAIVAGALSVGIGFGLQNIVNNFVSGLILLIERPVKVGDWVVVGDQQGFVRRINVRSTELETFERSSVILPNSDLLSGAVVNWTHNDRIGRVDVRVGVDYGVDVERVREVLLSCARAHPEILGWPQPYVLFQDFADSALVFEVRAFLRDVEKRLRVASELRFAIERACREAGIAFPYPQSDVHLRDIDRLEKALSGHALRPSPAAEDPVHDSRQTRQPDQRRQDVPAGPGSASSG